MPCCTEKYKLSHIHDFKILYKLQPETAHSPSEHKDKHGFIISQPETTHSPSEPKDKHGFIISQCKQNKLQKG